MSTRSSTLPRSSYSSHAERCQERYPHKESNVAWYILVLLVIVTACSVTTLIPVGYLVFKQISTDVSQQNSNGSLQASAKRETGNSILSRSASEPEFMSPEAPHGRIKSKVSGMQAFVVSFDSYEFDAVFLTNGSVSYAEMKSLCDVMKDLAGHATHRPIFTLTRNDGKFLQTLAGVLSKYQLALLEPGESQALVWTGAFFNLASRQPYVMHLPDNQVRPYLGHLQNDWCPESSNYRAVIDEKIAQFKQHDGLAKLLHVVLKYSLSGSLCLDLYDESNEDDQVAKPIAACQSRYTEFQPCEKCSEEPHPTYYFPRIIQEMVSFSNARKQCQFLNGYAYDLSGLDQANFMFLEASEKLVASSQGLGVWVGGHFELKSQDPYFVRWSDGRTVSDALKSPDAIWCQHPRDVIPRVLQSIDQDLFDQLDSVIVPIVRLTGQSNCLTLYTDDAVWPDRSLFYPLCVANPLEIAMKTPDDVLIPPLYQETFSKAHMGFVNVAHQICCVELKTLLLGHTNPADPHVVWSVKELVTYHYAEKLCRHVRADVNTPEGSLLTDAILNSNSTQRYKSSMQNFHSSLEPFAANTSLTTAGRFDFRDPKFNTLLWQTFFKTREGDMKLEFPWCPEHNTTGILLKTHSEFVEWYDSSGSRTSGPNYVYLAIENRPLRFFGACLRLVTDDLYWPGTHKWAPVCQARN